MSLIAARNRCALTADVAHLQRLEELPDAKYWSQVNPIGRTLPQVEGVVGPPKCAIMLHSVCDPHTKEEAAYYTSPRRFHELMRSFLEFGYSTATTAQWLRDEVPANHVLLTFDDGYDDLYEHLLPLVIEHHYTPIVYLVADHIGGSNVWDQASGLRARNLLTVEQIREMQNYGVEFGSHTLTHPRLSKVSDAQLHREVTDSKHRIEELLGVEVTSFAYPFGDIESRVCTAVAGAGYKLAFTVEPGLNRRNDLFRQRRAEVNDSTTVSDFKFILRRGSGLKQFFNPRRFLKSALNW